ncbi:hypothetical protein [Larsenimonas rhizosphaerae]|uniref:hypothetical protein n=1 Tax=Larsenimonas rhizosphaerae TaxID=2944682 RepID=UPI002033AF9C|nr:hypothetical protein [Larsenimonas rhizosphaerae]MCM2132198.1 hypothetical protein [Larsenimonas rhizosphaerae]
MAFSFSMIDCGEELTASSIALPGVTLTRRDGEQHRYSQTDRDNFTGVRELWNDIAGSKRQIAIADERGKIQGSARHLRLRG